MSITQLKDICRTNNVSGYSNKNKNDLIMWMLKQDKIMKKV